jgi:hypothetical protein
MKKHYLTSLFVAGLGLAMQAQTVTFNFTGGIQTFTVPCGVDSVFIQTWGAQGAAGANGNSNTGPVLGGSGGLGGYAEGWLAVNPGDVLNIFVGGQGSNPTGGFNGGANGGSQNAGGGGGATDIRVGGTAEANRVIIAGGGGGGGRGGCEGSQGAAGVGGNGGFGGGGVGTNGGNSATSGGSAGGGFGGNFNSVQGASGGAGVGCSGFLGAPGATAGTGIGGNGGAGQSCCCFSFTSIPGGGGGGGGLTGGGGGGGGSAGTSGCSGNDKGAGGGGGGGSSYVGGVLNGVTNNGIWLGDGQAAISWADPTPPTHTISGTTGVCQNSNTTLSINADQYSTFYTWTVPAAFNFISGQNTTSIDIQGLTPGTYWVYVTGVNGPCNLAGPTDSIQVEIYALPVVSANASSAVCAGNSVGLTASGAVTYVWNPGNLTGTAVSVTPSSTTTYTVDGTDVNGCVGSTTVTADIFPLPTLVTSNNATTCAGDTVVLNVNGAATYVWNPGNLTGVSINVNPTATTTYTVVGTDVNGCNDTANVTVTVNQNPTVTISAQGTHCLDDASFTLSGGAPAGGAYSGPGVTGATFSPATAGVGTHPITYSYTDQNGCSGTATNNVIVNACVGITEYPGFVGVNFMPNPAVDNLSIRWDATQTTINVIEVRDIQGRVLLTQSVVVNGTADLNVSALRSGNYTLTLISNNSKANYTFVKQ